MTRFALLGVAALLSAAATSPVAAQEVIYNPGYCAQFYPNANCQNKGPNNPYTGDYQRRNQFRDSLAWSAGPWALNSIVAATAAGTIATEKIQNRPSIGRPALLFVRDTHFLDNARIFGELI